VEGVSGLIAEGVPLRADRTFPHKELEVLRVFSLYAALAVGFVLTAVLFTVAIPFLVGLFDRHDLF